tara:strand:- start:3136 stop:3405 length:270 start_codon:yes stop_codon:yes gene_type:complete
MKWVLVIMMCSQYQGICLDPHKFDEKYDDVYSCLIEGYNKSIEKTEELGKKEVNKHKIIMKFDCYEDKTYKSAISGESFTKAIQSSYKR